MFDYYVYILTNFTNSVLYVGITNWIERRTVEHKNGFVNGFTKKYHIHKLVYFEHTNDVTAALEREKQLKKYSRKKKEDLINSMNPEWRDLSYDIFHG